MLVSDEDKHIPPGGEGKIDVALSTGSYDSKKNKSIKVTSNASDKPLVLRIKADVKADLSISPTYLRIKENKNRSLVQEVTLTNRTQKMIEISEIEASHDYIDLQNANQIKQIEPGKNAILYVGLKDGLPPNTNFNGNITIKTNLQGVSNFNIKFSGTTPGNSNENQEEPAMDQGK